MKRVTLIADKLWFNIAQKDDVGLTSIDLQHRIANPPALRQTCHHLFMFKKWRIYYRKEVI